MDISVTTPVFGCATNDMIGIARLAEDSDVHAILSSEVPPYSSLANAHLMSHYTKETKIGTWISNIYLRHSVMCAAEAMTIQEASGGRMLLGLGVSHAPVKVALGIDMGDPIIAVKINDRYVLKGGHHRAAVMYILGHEKLPGAVVYSKLLLECRKWLIKIKRYLR